MADAPDPVGAAVAAAAADLRTPEDAANPDYVDTPESLPDPEPADPEADPPADPEADKPKTEEEELAALEAEAIAADPKLADGRIPTGRHKAVLTRARNKHAKELKALQAQLTPLQQPDVTEKIAAADLAEHNPAVFLRQVLMNDPRYQVEIKKLMGELGQPPETTKPSDGSPAASATEASPTEPGPQPKPDVILSDGSTVYSQAQQEKLVEWHTAKLRKDHAEQMAKLRKDVDPMLAHFKNAEELGAARTRQGAVLKSARETWHGFKDNEAAIYTELTKKGNERMTLDTAYRNIVIPKAATDRAKIRAEERASVLKELKGTQTLAPAVTPAGSPPSTVGTDPDSDPITDVIAAAARKLR